MQRAQQREGFRVEVTRTKASRWTPAPRECAQITTGDNQTYLTGGMNFEAIKEITKARIVGDTVDWDRVPFSTGEDTVKGRQCHSTVSYEGKMYMFGGCFSFTPKRGVRECTAQVVCFDYRESHCYYPKMKGYAV